MNAPSLNTGCLKRFVVAIDTTSPVRSRAARNPLTMRSRSLALAPSGTRSLSCSDTPYAPSSASFSTATIGSRGGRVGSPNGSRPGFPTVQSPNENRLLGVGTYEGSGVTAVSLCVSSASARLRVRATTRRRNRLLDPVDQGPARRPRERHDRGLGPGAPRRDRRGRRQGDGARGLVGCARASGRQHGPGLGGGRDLGRRPAARTRRARRGWPSAPSRDPVERHPVGTRRGEADRPARRPGGERGPDRQRPRRLLHRDVVALAPSRGAGPGSAGRARAPAARLHDRATLGRCGHRPRRRLGNRLVVARCARRTTTACSI